MAGRLNKADSPHVMWDMFDSIPNGNTMSYWQRVLYLVNAAEYRPVLRSTWTLCSKLAWSLTSNRLTGRGWKAKTRLCCKNEYVNSTQKLQDETTKRAKMELGLQQVNTEHPDATPTSCLETLIGEIASSEKRKTFHTIVTAGSMSWLA